MNERVAETHRALEDSWAALGARTRGTRLGPWLAVEGGPIKDTNHALLGASGGAEHLGDVEAFYGDEPFQLEVLEDADPATDERLAASGYRALGEVPLMRLDADALTEPSSAAAFTIAEDRDVFLDVAADGFAMPRENAAAFLAPWWGDPSAVFLLGSLDGEPVATAVAIHAGDAVGVFMVATVEHARGKGIGAAITARAAAEGIARGARFSFLQPSRSGYPVYKRLGFRTVARHRWYERLA